MLRAEVGDESSYISLPQLLTWNFRAQVKTNARQRPTSGVQKWWPSGVAKFCLWFDTFGSHRLHTFLKCQVLGSVKFGPQAAQTFSHERLIMQVSFRKPFILEPTAVGAPHLPGQSAASLLSFEPTLSAEQEHNHVAKNRCATGPTST